MLLLINSFSKYQIILVYIKLVKQLKIAWLRRSFSCFNKILFFAKFFTSWGLMELYSVLQSFNPEETFQLLKINSYRCFLELTFHFDTD